MVAVFCWLTSLMPTSWLFNPESGDPPLFNLLSVCSGVAVNGVSSQHSV
jgi:hypothetical protein